MKAATGPPIAIFGGSFNPPHVGHLMVASWLWNTRDLGEMWLVPTFEHPFDKSLAPYEARVEMCQALANAVGGTTLVSRLEEELGGVSYTVRMLEAAAQRSSGRGLLFVLGSDLLSQLPQWRDSQRLWDLADPVVVPRVGHPIEDPDTQAHPWFPDVSSTVIRQRLADGESVEALVPKGVLASIKAQGLYGPSGL